MKVLRTGICGTDLHIDQWNPWAQRVVPTPLTIGHEFCGEIVELGSAVEDLEVGMFVSGEGHYVCGRCRSGGQAAPVAAAPGHRPWSRLLSSTS